MLKNDPNYFLLLDYFSKEETDVLFEHTRRLRETTARPNSRAGFDETDDPLDPVIPLPPPQYFAQPSLGPQVAIGETVVSRQEPHVDRDPSNKSKPPANDKENAGAASHDPDDADATLLQDLVKDLHTGPKRRQGQEGRTSSEQDVGKHLDETDWHLISGPSTPEIRRESRSKDQPLSKWQHVPEDTATWLYRLVFEDQSTAQDSMQGKPKVNANAIVPKSVDRLLLQWTEGDAVVDADSPSESVEPDDLDWKQRLDGNTRAMVKTLASQSGLPSGRYPLEDESDSEIKMRSGAPPPHPYNRGSSRFTSPYRYYSPEELKRRVEEETLKAQLKLRLEYEERTEKEKAMRKEEELKKKAEKEYIEAKKAKTEAISGREIRFLCPAVPGWNTSPAAAGSNMSLEFGTKLDDASKHLRIHGTLLFTSPMLPSASEMYTQLKGRGWNPRWSRANQYGETWFLGTQPIHVVFHHRDYRPQFKRLDSEYVASEIMEGDVVVIAEEHVELEAFRMLGLEPLDRRQGQYYFRPELTSHDVENLIATSMLVREHRLRANARALAGVTSVAIRKKDDEEAELVEQPSEERSDERRRRKHRTDARTSGDLLSPPSHVSSHRRGSGSRGSASDMSGNESRSSARSSRKDPDHDKQESRDHRRRRRT